MKATYLHARNLGFFVFIFKSVKCIMRHIRKKETVSHELSPRPPRSSQTSAHPFSSGLLSSAPLLHPSL